MATIRSNAPWAGLRIGPGGTADAADIEALSARAFDPGFREAWTARQVVQALASPGGFLFVARSPDLLGFALSRSAVDACELLLCAVAPEARRTGLARALVARTVDEARARGLATIFLEVRESNHAARRLYEHTGFHPVGMRPGYYRSVTGQSVAALTLRRAVS